MSDKNDIYVIGYWHKNLGDDLFLKILCDRYRESNFFVVSNDDYDHMFPNLRNKGNRVLNKLLRVVSRENISLSTIYECTSDFTIVLGGSIFIESDQPYKKWMKQGSTYYVLGANFGPYRSQGYYEYHKKFLSAAQDVCFRENNSQKLFSDLPNVRAEADIVFGLERNSQTIAAEDIDNMRPNAKSAVLSVMNFRAHPEIDHALYEQMILEACRNLDRKGYEVTLMSFCSFEGDEQAVLALEEQCRKANVPVKTYLYSGEIDEALSVLEKSEIIMATRYHAVILGLLMGRKVLPLAYSDKTIHVLSDIGFGGDLIDLREMSKASRPDVEQMIDKVVDTKREAGTEEKKTRSQALDIEELRKSAQRQFMVLDNALLR